MKPSSRRKPQPQVNGPKFNQGKEVRAIARERIGVVKPSQVIPSQAAKDKKQRRQPKHKPPAGAVPAE